MLADAVRVIRRFKPQVVVAVFPPDARSGHGQHWLSGLIAPRAFHAARQPVASADGMDQSPWAPEAFYRLSWASPGSETVRLPLGIIDPASGRSILQLALDSRSQHRSQDMGLIQALGDATTSLTWEEGAGSKADTNDDLFAGIDTRLAALAASLPASSLRTGAEASLARVSMLSVDAREQLTPQAMDEAVAPLREIIGLLGRLSGALEISLTDSSQVDAATVRGVLALVSEKTEIAVDALMAASGIALDAYTDRETLVAGTRLAVHAVLWNSGAQMCDDLGVEVMGDPAWDVVDAREAEPVRSRFATSVTMDRVLEVAVPDSAPVTMPYFLRQPRDGYLYDWSATPPEEHAEPFGRPPLRVRFRFTVDGTPVTVVREVVYRTVDQASGEVRRPLRVVPAFEVVVTPSSLVWRIGNSKEVPLRVELRSHLDESMRVSVDVVVPAGWPAVPPQGIEVMAQDRVTLVVPVSAPATLAQGRYQIDVAAVTDDGRRFALGVPMIDYDHIRPTPRPVAASVALSAGEISLPALKRVGYIRGASDRVPEALASIGVPVELLDSAALGDAPLAAFDAIVVGSRAYETDPALVAANERLLAYARGGGLLIVQYQQYAFVRGGFAPYPLEIARPHDRTTDELAPVRVLLPDHPVFQIPNRIDAGDWAGWVQERGLYFARTWDPAFQPLLAMADPEGVEREGVLLVAPLGSGHYVYTGLAFFRQLPAGVTGAFRLFANLLNLGGDA